MYLFPCDNYELMFQYTNVHFRLEGEEYYELIDEFMAAIKLRSKL